MTAPLPTPSDDDARLARAVRSIVGLGRVFEQVCREAGVSLPQYRLLVFLRHGPGRAGELAAKVAIKRPTLTALVAGLEREGRLRRVADEHDGRGVRIEITHAGQRALDAVEARLADALDRLCARGDRDALLQGLDALGGILDEVLEQRLSATEARNRR